MKQLNKRLVAFLLVLAIAAAIMPAAQQPVHALDLNKSCSLTVNPGDSMFQDLHEAGPVIDLYFLAYPEQVEDYDAYTWNFREPYAGLQQYIDAGNITNEVWDVVSKQATDIAFEGEMPVVTAAPVGEKIEDLECGLYLVITRGADMEDYTKDVTDKKTGEVYTATYVTTPSYDYVFRPCLVSLPGKDAAADNGIVNMADRSDWKYEQVITLKPEQDPRFTTLSIMKSIPVGGFNANAGPVTFVFQVEATATRINKKGVSEEYCAYSDVVAITFNKEGDKSALLDKIPIGATVTVTEIYSGNTYNLTSDKSQTIVVEVDNPPQVSFTNASNDIITRGGSITNYFEYTGEQWNWTPLY